MFKYSESEHACYNVSLKYKSLPSDLVSITKEDHDTYWLSKPPQGKALAVGYPFSFVDLPKRNNEDLFKDEMRVLNENHYQDVLEATNQYNIAVARDGSTEGDKVAVARAILADIDAKHELDQLAIIEKYYGA